MFPTVRRFWAPELSFTLNDVRMIDDCHPGSPGFGRYEPAVITCPEGGVDVVVDDDY